MAQRGTVLTIVFFVVVIGAIFTALMFEAARNPVFRAEDYDSLAECMNGIPAEWSPGSLDYMQAESACAYVHGGGRTGRP